MSKYPKDLFEAAREGHDCSYSPYSQHSVGAAIRTESGIFRGCNVENSSYGATICAERNAIHSAVAAGALSEMARIQEVLVVTNTDPAWPPCGMCRQVIAEFIDHDDILVHSVNLEGKARTWKFKDLLPDAFTPAHLKK